MIRRLERRLVEAHRSVEHAGRVRPINLEREKMSRDQSVGPGGAEVINGGGITIVLNNGNAEFLKFNKNHIVCINCF